MAAGKRGSDLTFAAYYAVKVSLVAFAADQKYFCRASRRQRTSCWWLAPRRLPGAGAR
jgi:hypothetical protein